MSTNCFLCDQESKNQKSTSRGGVYVVCERCGEYEISDELKHFTSQLKSVSRYLLSGLCRELYETEQEPPLLMTTNIEELLSKFPVPDEDLDAKLEKLLKAIKRRSKYFGDMVDLVYYRDYPLAYSQNSDEFIAFINHLDALGLLDIKGKDTRAMFVSLSAKGWKYFSRLTTDPKSKQGFVAAWFDPSTDNSILAIKEAIESCGFNPMCIKTELFKETIMDKALGELQRSRFVVVDLTGDRGSVFYEAGYARALNIESIFVYRDGEAESGSRLEFYVKHYQCHKYKTPDELREIVTNAIRARIN